MRSVINIIYGNHSAGGATLEGIVAYLKASIESAGYRVSLSDLPIAGRPNIIVDSFYEHAVTVVRRYSQQGIPLILLATENVAPDGYWPGTASPFKSEDVRFESLKSVIPEFRAIWCMLPGQVFQYKTAFNFENVFHIPHGYCANYFSFDWIPEAERDIDFFFSGTMTPYRQHIVDSLRARGFCCEAVPASTPMFISNNLISRSRICLALRQNPTWTSSSISRVHHYLMAKSYVITEACAEPSLLDGYTRTVNPEVLVEECARILAAGGLIETALEQFERFKLYEPISDDMDMIIKSSLQ